MVMVILGSQSCSFPLLLFAVAVALLMKCLGYPLVFGTLWLVQSLPLFTQFLVIQSELFSSVKKAPDKPSFSHVVGGVIQNGGSNLCVLASCKHWCWDCHPSSAVDRCPGMVKHHHSPTSPTKHHHSPTSHAPSMSIKTNLSPSQMPREWNYRTVLMLIIHFWNAKTRVRSCHWWKLTEHVFKTRHLQNQCVTLYAISLTMKIHCLVVWNQSLHWPNTANAAYITKS